MSSAPLLFVFLSWDKKIWSLLLGLFAFDFSSLAYLERTRKRLILMEAEKGMLLLISITLILADLCHNNGMIHTWKDEQNFKS